MEQRPIPSLELLNADSTPATLERAQMLHLLMQPVLLVRLALHTMELFKKDFFFN